MTVLPGTQKVTFGRNSDTDYESKLRAAQAQAGENAYIQGVQAAFDNPGAATKERSAYGDTSVKPGQLFASNFSQQDSPGNEPLNDRLNQTGSLDTQASSTSTPQQDPEEMETDALSRRLKMMAKGGQGFPGLNDRNREV